MSRKHLRNTLLAIALPAATLFAADIANAGGASASLRLTNGAATTTVFDNGAGDSNATPGVIEFVGAVGDFNVNVTTGLSYPFQGEIDMPELDLSSINVASGSIGTLILHRAATQRGYLAVCRWHDQWQRLNRFLHRCHQCGLRYWHPDRIARPILTDRIQRHGPLSRCYDLIKLLRNNCRDGCTRRHRRPHQLWRSVPYCPRTVIAGPVRACRTALGTSATIRTTPRSGETRQNKPWRMLQGMRNLEEMQK